MTCPKCQGLVVEDYGEHRCIQCGCRPFEKLITVKCSNPDCFALPELNGYCTPCWHSRKRSTLTEAQKAKMYREKQRRANAAKRAKRAQRKEAMRDARTEQASQGEIAIGVCGEDGKSSVEIRSVAEVPAGYCPCRENGKEVRTDCAEMERPSVQEERSYTESYQLAL